MSLTSFQITLLALEILSLAYGSLLLARFLNLPGFKPQGSTAGRLAYWPMEGFEVALLVLLILFVGIVSQGMLAHFWGEAIKASADRKGLEIAVYGLATHGGGLLAWPLFFLLRRSLFSSYNTVPPVAPGPAPARAPWSHALRGGVATLLVALPLIFLVSISWHGLLSLLGLPAEPQDLIAVFRGIRSQWLVAGMLAVACVLAPMNEELLFRRGLYHFFRQRFGRTIALTVSASLFGLLHMNLAGFLPLATLGVILALAYERTGDIRVPIIAHALFNLNTLVVLLAGLSG